jgi:hypothetical protein
LRSSTVFARTFSGRSFLVGYMAHPYAAPSAR